jgi:Dihydroorotate dehydrogenase
MNSGDSSDGVRQGQEGPEPAFGRSMLTGLAGRPILQHGLKCVFEIATIRETQNLRGITIIGMGGVATPPDALSYLQNGADVVQCANGFIDNPNFGIEVRQYMDAKLPPYLQSVEHESQAAGANWGCAVARVLDDEKDADTERVSLCLTAASKEFESWHLSRKRTSALGPRRSSVPSVDEFYTRISTRLSKTSQ